LRCGTTPRRTLLFELLSDIERGDEEFVIVERLSDPEGQTYMQLVLDHDGTYTVEHRDGSAEEHYRAATADKREAHAVLWRWACDRTGWRDALAFENVGTEYG
jgi:hypothetical protein